MKEFIFSDPHFCHPNMAAHRGFLTTKDHDNYIIKQWNSVVGDDDTVYLLGDLGMGSTNEMKAVLKQLKGDIRLILGNHDADEYVRVLKPYFKTINSSLSLPIGTGYALLTHIPIHPTMLFEHDFNIHGHTHEDDIMDHRYVNVSADVLRLCPAELTLPNMWSLSKTTVVQTVTADDKVTVYKGCITFLDFYNLLVDNYINIPDSEVHEYYSELKLTKEVIIKDTTFRLSETRIDK